MISMRTEPPIRQTKRSSRKGECIAAMLIPEITRLRRKRSRGNWGLPRPDPEQAEVLSLDQTQLAMALRIRLTKPQGAVIANQPETRFGPGLLHGHSVLEAIRAQNDGIKPTCAMKAPDQVAQRAAHRSDSNEVHHKTSSMCSSRCRKLTTSPARASAIAA